jgi:NOL1/NOP2/sun family putative RNA methylase
MRSTYFPEEFISKYKKFCGVEWPAFFETIKIKQPKSFWVNSHKANVNEIKSFLKKKNIPFENHPFSKQAFLIDYTRPGDLSIFRDGKISMQEKAAMLPVIALNPTKKDFVLDACAAPGMKTIQLSNLSGQVVAVDVSDLRTKSLLHNKTNYHLKNTRVIRNDVRNIKEEFDKIMLDAPCSSEGLVRKRKEALKGWSQRLVFKKTKIQKNMIIECFDMLKPKGEMVYATCSFAKEENEEVVNFLLEKRESAEVVPVTLPGIKIRDNKWCEHAVRLWPQDNDTQQFFFAKIKKK